VDWSSYVGLFSPAVVAGTIVSAFALGMAMGVFASAITAFYRRW
jgi:hypothetical protein